MKINGNISCNRVSNDSIRIEIEDNLSGSRFVSIKLSLEDFALMITGLSGIKFQGDVQDLDVVGKQKVTERRSVEYTGDQTYDKKRLEQWIRETQQESGWILRESLSSQSSISTKEGKTILNYFVYKYVEV